MNCGSEKNFVVVLYREGFERLHDLREKRIGYFGNDQAKHAAFSRYQSTRLPVGVISKFFNRFPDAFRQLRIDGRNLVDSA
jgi:hypothetical protein